MFCTKCGVRLKDKAMFCNDCGAPAPVETAPTTETPAPTVEVAETPAPVEAAPAAYVEPEPVEAPPTAYVAPEPVAKPKRTGLLIVFGASLVALIIVICVIFFYVLPGLSGDDDGGYARGKLTETEYASQYLNLKFTLPDGYIMATEADMAEMMGMSMDALELDNLASKYMELNVIFEMSASAPSGLPNVILSLEKLIFSTITEDQYMEALESELTSIFGSDLTVLGASQETIAGQNYKVLSFSHNFMGVSVLQDYLVRKIDNRIIGFVVTYTDDTVDERNRLMGSFTKY